MKHAALAWDTDIERCLYALTRDRIADHEFWSATVDRIEDGLHPTENKHLTLEDLEAWAERCQTRNPANEDLQTVASAPHRSVRHPRA